MSLPSRTRFEKETVPRLETDDSTTDDSDEDDDQHSIMLKAPTQPQTSTIASESGSSSTSSPAKSLLGSTTVSPNPKAKLGKIGGTTKPNVSPRKPKIGHIGGVSNVDDRQERSHHGVVKSPEPRGRSAPIVSPQPREDSVERANKKREQLKRDLELQSKGGIKKKRRF